MSEAALVLLRKRSDPQVLTPDHACYYRALTHDELHAAISCTLEKIKGSVGRTTEEIRAHLLPALLAMREHHKARRQWERYLRRIGLRPGTVRQWFRRSRSAEETIELLGEQAVPRRRSRTADQTQDRILARAGIRLAQAVLGCATVTCNACVSDLRRPKRLAREILEAAEEYTQVDAA